jgi:hypothetical protein
VRGEGSVKGERAKGAVRLGGFSIVAEKDEGSGCFVVRQGIWGEDVGRGGLEPRGALVM